MGILNVKPMELLCSTFNYHVSIRNDSKLILCTINNNNNKITLLLFRE